MAKRGLDAMKPEKIMKECQAGKATLDGANNLLAQCYGVIGRLIDDIEQMGIRSNECTRHSTGRKCKNCGCGYKGD